MSVGHVASGVRAAHAGTSTMTLTRLFAAFAVSVRMAQPQVWGGLPFGARRGSARRMLTDSWDFARSVLPRDVTTATASVRLTPPNTNVWNYHAACLFTYVGTAHRCISLAGDFTARGVGMPVGRLASSAVRWHDTI